jgi:hypothetical protein
MKLENARELTKRYPALFAPVDPRYPMSMFGFEVGDGWYNILDELCADLTKMIEESDEDQSWFRVIQVKEKFGTLRFYMSFSTGEMEDRIRQAEDHSAVTCECCGAPGETNGVGWLTTLCVTCRSK